MATSKMSVQCSSNIAGADDAGPSQSQPVNNFGGDPIKMEGVTTDDSEDDEEVPSKKKRKRKPLTAEQREKVNEKRRLQRSKMTPEEKARDNQKKRRKYLEATEEEREEMKRRRNFHLYCKRLEMTDEQRKEFNTKTWLRKQARLAQMTEEEKEAMKRRNVEAVHNYYKNLRGEHLEKHRAMVNECARNRWKKQPDKMLEYFRRKTAEETPMQRKRRLRGYKINQRRRQMKREMEREGMLDGEEIERRLKEWVRMERGRPVSPVREGEEGGSVYKPRLSGRKPKEGSKRWREIHEGRPRTPPPSRKGQRRRRSCWKLPPVPVEEQEENLVRRKSPPSLFGGRGTSKVSVGPPPPSHQICILNHPLPPHFKPDTKEDPPPPSPCNSFGGGDDYPSPPGSPSSPPQNYQEDTALPLFQLEDDLPPSPPPPVTVPSSSPWKCPLCSAPIPSLSSLPHHLHLHHHPLLKDNSLPNIPPSPPTTSSSSPFQCILCPWPTHSPPIYLQFKKSSDLLSHVYLHHPTSYYPCPSCPLLYYSSSRLSIHLLHCSKKPIPSKILTTSTSVPSTPSKPPKAPPPPKICEDCGRTFSTNRAYNFHQRHSHPLKTQGAPLTCPKCPRTCKNLRNFWLHFAQCGLKNLKPPPPSNPPSLSFPLPKIYPRSTSDLSHFCFQCPKTFIQKATLDDHIRRDHLGLTHQCPQCLKNFQSSGKVWRHQIEYHGLSPSDLPPAPRGVEAVNCKYCGRLIMRGYEQHVKKMHSVEEMADFRENVLPEWKAKQEATKVNRVRKGGGGEKMACLFCPAILPKRSLQRHVKSQHDEPEGEWRCQDCGNEYRDQEKLEAHRAQVHAYQEMEDILKREGLICETKKMRDAKMLVDCKLCGLELPYPDKYSVRVHFVISHYEVIQRFFGENGKLR